MALIFDLEGNGLLPKLTKMHCLVIHDTKTSETRRFRNNDVEDTMEEGLRLLMSTDDTIVGHNVISYDIPAIKKLYPWFDVSMSEVRDTLVMVKIAVPDIKDADMGAWRRKTYPSNLIGSHSLKAWGYRLGKHKGDYADDMHAKGLDPWVAWNPEMEDYCVLDVEVTTLLWRQLQAADLHPDCVFLEHDIHTVCAEMENNGFPFDKAEALNLVSQLEKERDRLHAAVVDEVGVRLRPLKRKVIKPLFYDPDNVQAKKEAAGLFAKPDTVNGEDYSRKWWGEVTVPKRKYTRNGVTYDPDCPFVKCEFKEFNPGSRQQIVDFLAEEFDWTPTEFTEGGSPSVDAATLEKLADTVPVCGTMAELFFYDKLLGQMSTGPQAWIKHVDEGGLIHCHINTGGTVTGRCTHSKPNLGQVPGVVAIKTMKDGKPNPIFLNEAGEFLPHCYDFHGKLKKESPLIGRKGDFGWECRSLFRVPEKWTQVGVDLSGIEFRALAHLTAEFDGGELVDVVLNGDIHAFNQQKTSIPTRDVVKRILYGCVPMDTQALTITGWKTYDQLTVGELVMTYNAETGLKEWQPVLEKVYYASAPLVEMSTDHSFKVVSTPNHRWYTKRRTGRGGHRYYVDEVVTTENITGEHAIIVNAPMKDYPQALGGTGLTLPKYGTDWTQRVLMMSNAERDAFVTGFVLADGYFKPSKNGVKNGRYSWCQNVGDISEAVLLASYLSTSNKLYVVDRKDAPSPMIVVKHGVNNNVTGQRLKKTTLPNAPVWCIRTANQTWVMRQGNTITITGNTLYGAGDHKLGVTADPLLDYNAAKALGARLRAQLMEGLPALNEAIKKVKRDAQRGYIVGLDGRRIKVRSEHSALNTRLQSDAAIIAKRWVCLTRHNAEKTGAWCGWNDGAGGLGDYVMMAFVHDETQTACAPDFAREFAALCIAAAKQAGEDFEYRCPISAEAKLGYSWAQCH